MGYSYQDRERGQKRREQVAYCKIALGMTLGECALRLGMNAHTVDFYWHKVKQQIRSAR